MRSRRANLRHLPAIVGNGVPNELSFELFERSHLAVDIEQRQHVRAGSTRRRDWKCRRLVRRGDREVLAARSASPCRGGNAAACDRSES